MKKLLLLWLCFYCLNVYGQVINTIAGTGVAGYTGDGGPATSGTIKHPAQITKDAAGNVYFAETENHIIRKINTAGIISTVAGTGIAGFSGDGGLATAAQLNGPYGVDVDATGNIYISDFFNNRMRMVNTAGIITTIAGTGIAGFSGDGGAATAAKLYYPGFFRLDNSGNIIISDNGNMRVRKINTSGIISTIAGNGIGGYSGDGGAATAAELYYPDGIWVDNTGNVFIGDAANNVVRKVNTAGIISTYAGTGAGGFSGDGGLATSAELYTPQAIFGDNLGNLYIPDTRNNRIRVVNSSGIINTIVGTAIAGYNGDGIVASTAELYYPNSVYLDGAGDIYISDASNQRIREITAGAGCSNFLAMPDTLQLCTGDTATLYAVHTGTDPVTSYTWSGVGLSSSTILNPVLTGTTSGWYYLTVDASLPGHVCIAKDSMYVQVRMRDTSFMHSDTSVCVFAGSITLSAPAGYTSPIWSSGATITSISISSGGIYWVKDEGTCDLRVDTFNIGIIVPDLGVMQTDTAICTGESVALHVPNGYAIHTWSTGDTASDITVNTAGTYWVTGESITPCMETIDSFHVANKPLPLVNVGNDTAICIHDTITLSSPGSSGTYLWSTGSMDSSIMVSGGGTYVLTVSQNGCNTSDTILIMSLTLPILNLGHDTTLCKGDVLVLSADTMTVQWSNGITGPSISVTDSGIYRASLTNACGSVTDSVKADFELCDLYFPSGFTPNGDGKNDVACAVGYLSLIRSYSLNIYNRFGQRVYYTENIYEGWNGVFNGVQQDVGVYYYMIRYAVEGKHRMIKGDLTLIR